jgi:hypothetical protein
VYRATGLAKAGKGKTKTPSAAITQFPVPPTEHGNARAREQGQSSLISPKCRGDRSFGLADSAASRFDLPFVLDDLSLQFVRARNGRSSCWRPWPIENVGGSLESGRVDRGATPSELVGRGSQWSQLASGNSKTHERRLGRRGSPPSGS